MRSRQEILFRLRQETRNLWLWHLAPIPPEPPATPIAGLPHPAALAQAIQGTAWAEQLASTAECIVQHQFPLFDQVIETGPTIDWRRDYHTGISSPLQYFRRVKYLDAKVVGDHKFVWELNRHQHLVTLAQAYLVGNSTGYLAEIWTQLESWLDQNPFPKGINWASALEVAFRALSWFWIWHLVGREMPAELQPRFLTALYRHAQFLEANLSVYFSPNTHLLGEAVALHALGVLFREDRWRAAGSQLVEDQLDRQVQDDGMHFEQSSYYHVYALDMFLFYAILEGQVSEAYRETLAKMAEVLTLLLGPDGAISLLGDDDGGRLFYPYGPRDEFGRATLATCSLLLGGDWAHETQDCFDQALWWLGRTSRSGLSPLPRQVLLEPSGLVFLHLRSAQVILDAGPFGAGSAGHSHADALSLVFRASGEELLHDPGTYTYVGEPEWREIFRGSAMHNTLHVRGAEQAQAAGPFRWRDLPQVSVEFCRHMRVIALCKTSRYWHRRRLAFVEPGLLVVVDETDATGGLLNWQVHRWSAALSPVCVQIGEVATLTSSVPLSIEDSWRSRIYGSKHPAKRLQAEMTHPVATVIDLRGETESVELAPGAGGWKVTVPGRMPIYL